MDVLEKSSKLIGEYLDNVSDEEFLALYDSVAIGDDGITVDEYLEASKSTCKVFICDESYEEEASFITAIFDWSISSHDSANDDSYSSTLSSAA